MPAAPLRPTAVRTSPGDNDRLLAEVRRRLPRELALGFRTNAGEVAHAAVRAVAQSVPEYAHVLSGPLEHIMSAAAQTVIVRSIDLILSPKLPHDDSSELLLGIGQGEFRAGRPLRAIHAALATVERSVAQQIVLFLRHRGASNDLAKLCVDLVSAQCRELARCATRGYNMAMANGPRPIDVAREDLVKLLLAEPPVDVETVFAASRAVGWNAPERIRVIALNRPADRTARLPQGFAAGALSASDAKGPFLIVADDSELPTDLGGWQAAVGPLVPLTDARASLRIARRALDLVRRGLLAADEVIDCGEHRTMLTLFADDWLIDRLVERQLAPLEGLTERQRERMLVTLHEWLATRGHALEIAEHLGVHPQTVRYRVGKLQELFGARLDDPSCRFELALAAKACVLRETPQEEFAARAS